VTSAESNFAVLFADVAGSTRLYEQLGDAKALAMISQCLQLARECSEGYGGRLVKTIGDEAMLVFPTADQAAAAAAEIQDRMARLGETSSLHLAFRIGFHFGAAIERDGDLFGDSVNTAARLVALAKGGQIILSSATAQRVSPFIRHSMRELDVVSVKGKEHDIGIVELLWNESSSDLTMLVSAPAPPGSVLELHHGGQTIRLDATTSVLTLGRSDQNDLVLSDRRASRLHARIERRHDKFALLDESSNGTYVTFDGEPEFVLRHQEILLRGSGRIACGHAGDVDPEDTVSFTCGRSGA